MQHPGLRRVAISRIVTVMLVIIVIAVGAAAAYVLTSQPSSKKYIYVGVITPLSPPADYISGRQILATAEIWANYTNQHGGLTVNGTKMYVRLVVRDQTLDPATAISELQQEVTQYHIVGLIGPWESLVALPVANATQEYHTIMFVTYSWADQITSNHYKYVFRTGVYNSLIATKLVGFLKVKGCTNIANLAEDSSFGRGFDAALRQALSNVMPNANVTTVFTPPGATDYTSALTEFMNMNPKPNCLLMTLNVPGVVTANKEAYDMGFQKFATIIQPVDWPTYDGGKTWWQTLGNNGIGGIYASWAPPSLNLTPTGGGFYDLFLKSQGHPPAFWLIWYWDSLRILAQAIEATGSTDPNVLANYIANIQILGSTGQEIWYNNSGGPGSPLWHQWTGETLYVYQFTALNQPTNETKVIYTSAS